LEHWLEAARQGGLSPLLLVRGSRALAEPMAARLAGEIGTIWETEPQTLTHPEDLGAVLADLRTYSLFGGGKIVVAIETGVLADRDAASAMLEDVKAVLPFSGVAEDLGAAGRQAARRLLQILRLHDVDPAAGPPERVLGELPGAVFGKGKGGGEELRRQLEPLLAAALDAGLRGAGEHEASILADLLRDGAPERHLLVLVESAIAPSHPLLAALENRRAVHDAGELSSEKGGRIGGLDRLLEELERETGAAMRRDAAAELARRTLRGVEDRGTSSAVDADSAARFAAEYRKLASLGAGGRIDRPLVEDNVEDRGQEEVFPILDAIGAGKAAEAWAKVSRRLAGADDAIGERLALFGLLASFARRLVATGGAIVATGARRGESSFPRFKSSVAPMLQGEIDGVAKNPISGFKPFYLYKLYLAASRFPSSELATLPAKVLAAERRLKGDSDDPDSALAELVLSLSKPDVSSGPAAGAGNRKRGAGGGRS